jgi:hypothetical protein
MNQKLGGGLISPPSFPPPKPPRSSMGEATQENRNLVTLGVEKCENGYIIMSGGTKRLASNTDELKEQFIALLVQKKLTE